MEENDTEKFVLYDISFRNYIFFDAHQCIFARCSIFLMI